MNVGNASVMPTPGRMQAGYVETHDVATKVIFVIVACVSLSGSSFAITVMRRTKKTPYIARLLSTGLLMFDVMFIILSTSRKFITDTVINLNVQSMVTICLQLAVITVGMMAVERYILIMKPFFYIKNFEKKKIKKMILSVWCLEASLCVFVRYGVCYFHHQTFAVYTVPAVCRKLLSMYYALMLSIVLIISIVCYVKIGQYLLTVRKRDREKTIFSESSSLTIEKFKTTSLAFVYLVVIVLTSVAYAVIIVLINSDILIHTNLRLALEVVSLCNCFFDPFLYVIWFKECRLVILRMILPLCRCLEPKVREMSIQVYNIVVSKSTRDMP